MPVAPPPLVDPDAIVDTATKFVVLLGPNDGSLPTNADEVDYLQPLSISRSIGTSGRLETIALRWALERSGHRLVDSLTPVGYNRLVSVCAVVDETIFGQKLRQIAWGRIPEQRHGITANRETVTLTARIDDDLLASEKLTGYWQRQPSDSQVFLDGPLLFNPRIDGVVRGNCASLPATNEEDDTEPNYWWLDHDATDETHDDEPDLWTLAKAVHAVCWLCNDSQRYVINPKLADLEKAFADPNIKPSRMLRNVVIEQGHSLREALNTLLRPLHFGWRIDHSETPGERSRLTFFSLRAGIAVDLSIARPGTKITRLNNVIDNYSATINVADLANHVEAFSSPIEYENSWELWPAWNPDDDTDADKTPEKIASTHNSESIRHVDTWMLFTLNDGGQYSHWNRPGMPTPQALADKLIDTEQDDPDKRSSAIRRRRFRPCVAQGFKDKNSLVVSSAGAPPTVVGDRGYVLEVRDETSEPTGFDRWKVVGWDFEVMSDECSIRLRQPHGEIKFIMDNVPIFAPLAPLRLTACIRSDFSKWGTATRRTSVSPQGADIKMILDLSNRFHCRKMLATSRHYADRHEAITAFLGSGFQTIQIDTILPGEIRPGERVAIVDSTDCDGQYTIKTIARLMGLGQTIIGLNEKLPGITADGVLAFRSEEIDDSRLLQKHTERIRNKDDVASISLSASVDRFEPAYKIGEQVRSIKGRNLDLNASTSTADPQYLTIVGINYSLSGEQKTELLTETFRGENYDEGDVS